MQTEIFIAVIESGKAGVKEMKAFRFEKHAVNWVSCRAKILFKKWTKFNMVHRTNVMDYLFLIRSTDNDYEAAWVKKEIIL